MKQLLGTLFFCFLIIDGFAQKEETFIVSLDKVEIPEKPFLPFSAIKIIDARFDKSNIGCLAKNYSFKGMTKNKLVAVFPDSLQAYLPRVFEKLVALDKSSTDTVVMLVKQFRVADHLFNTLDTYHAPETILTLSVSFYKKSNDRLLKLFSLDDSWSKEWSATEEDGAGETTAYRNEAIVILFSKIFQNKDWRSTQTSFTWADMESGLRKRFQLPLYNDGVSKTGLYRTFEEFKNNNPTSTNINLRMKNNELVQVMDNENNPIDTKDYWGACDGQNRYILFKGAFHKLFPSDNSFQFLSSREEAKDRHMLATTTTRLLLLGTNNGKTVTAGPTTRVKPEHFYVNMDNGHIYLEELIGTENYERAIRILNNHVR